MAYFVLTEEIKANAKPFLKTTGFTLVELLVIVGIVAVLTSLLLPALGGMEEKARTAKCTENLRQIGAALLSFGGEHDGLLPMAGDTIPFGTIGAGGQAGWTEQIDSYVGSDRRVFVCPGSSRVLPNNLQYSYFLGCHAAYLLSNGFAPIRLSLVKDPARQIMGGDISADMFAAVDADKDDYTQDPAFAVSPAPFHKGSVNLVFCDGHIGNFKKWDDNTMTVNYSGTGGY